MKAIKKIASGMGIVVLLMGCSQEKAKEESANNEEQVTAEAKQEQANYKAIKLPQTAEEFVSFPVGKYGKLDQKKERDDATLQEIADEIVGINVDGLSDEEKKDIYISALFSLTKREMMDENVEAVFKETEAPSITEEEKKSSKKSITWKLF
jgi:hypothetical protein